MVRPLRVGSVLLVVLRQFAFADRMSHMQVSPLHSWCNSAPAHRSGPFCSDSGYKRGSGVFVWHSVERYPLVCVEMFTQWVWRGSQDFQSVGVCTLDACSCITWVLLSILVLSIPVNRRHGVCTCSQELGVKWMGEVIDGNLPKAAKAPRDIGQQSRGERNIGFSTRSICRPPFYIPLPTR